MRRAGRQVAAALATLALHGCGGGAATRETIRIVGSSTLYPFTTLVAERFVSGRADARAPVVEATGTGPGISLFCAGIGPAHPDIVGASRRMRASELAACRAHGVDAVLELPIGRDGIVFAQDRRGAPLALTHAALWRALAAAPGGVPNAARTWRDVDPALPPVPIRVHGPPAASGTRDALAERVLVPACLAADPAAADLRARDPDAFVLRCIRLRGDGAYVSKGESDAFIVQGLAGDPQAIGIFGWSYLAENAGRLRGVPLDGVAPDRAAIAAGRYPGARELYLYVKAAHLSAVPGLDAYVAAVLRAAAPGGVLERRGLIAGAPADRDRARAALAARTPLAAADLPR